jgi:hypothetical protein
MFWGTVIKEG